MKPIMRVFHCTLAASVVPPTLFVATILLTAAIEGGVSIAEFPALLSAGIALFLIAWLVALAHLLTLGLPAFFALRQMKALDEFSVSLAGFCAGAAPLSVLLWSSGGWRDRMLPVAIFGLLGFASAIAFWRLWVHLDSTTPASKTDPSAACAVAPRRSG